MEIYAGHSRERPRFTNGGYCGRPARKETMKVVVVAIIKPFKLDDGREALGYPAFKCDWRGLS